MSSISKSALVPYSAEKMFALVSDIESYPQFLPWCGATHIISQEQDVVVASIDIAYKGVQKSFTTRNLMQRGKFMEMHLVDGPFKRLQGYWRFESLGSDACKVSLDLDFEFSNRLVGLALGPIFEQIANTLVESFQQRASQCYGSEA